MQFLLFILLPPALFSTWLLSGAHYFYVLLCAFFIASILLQAIYLVRMSLPTAHHFLLRRQQIRTKLKEVEVLIFTGWALRFAVTLGLFWFYKPFGAFLILVSLILGIYIHYSLMTGK